MEAIAFLSGIKMLIDIFEGDWTGVATGILTAGLPGTEFVTLGGSVYYLFDLDGNYVGKKTTAGLKEFSSSNFRLLNESEVRSGFKLIKEKHSFTKRNEGGGFSKLY